MGDSAGSYHNTIRESQNAKKPCSPSQMNYQDSMAIADREYEFFVTTDEPHQPEGMERGLIRRLVMRNFFETKGAGVQNNVSEHNSASTVMAKKELKNRFRLSKFGEDGAETKSKRRDGKEEPATVKRKRPKAKRTLSTVTDASEVTQNGTSLASSPKGHYMDAEEQTIGKGKEKKQEKKLLLKINPSAHRFDPFDVLPVPGTQQLDMLFKLHERGSKTNSLAVNPKNTWWSFISNDAGLLHATLATWALYGMLVRGQSELRVDKLRHKKEAIKEINLKIASLGGKFTDELVGTVLTMASFENLLGAYNAAQLHVAALKRMVNARGGLFAFGHNDGLIRGIIWVDFHTAAAFHTPPSFPQIRLDPDTSPLPDKLLEEAACTSPTSLLQLSLAAVDCFNLFYRLHRLALAASSHWVGRVDRLTLSNLLYESEYIVLSVPDYSRDFLDFDLQANDEQDEDFRERESAAQSASVVEAILAASQMFIYAALRDIPANAKIFSILLERARIALARPSVSVIPIWKKERNIHMLLWTLVIACSVASPGASRSWWIMQLVEIMIELEIKSRFDLEMALQHVAWVDTYFNAVLGDIWEEVSQQNRAREMGHRGSMVDQPLSRPMDPSSEGQGMWEVQHNENESSSRAEGLVNYDDGRWKVDGWNVQF